MKEALVSPDLSVRVVESPVPQPGPGEILIKVECAGCNPKDWKYPFFFNVTANSGDDVAGTVAALGEGVFEFRPGDRVAAFHQMHTAGGAFAEYAIAPSSTTFHLPDHISYEEAVTVPLAGLTAALALYHNLSLPLPWAGNTSRIPLLIYGGSSATGSFAIKLAMLSNIHPLLVVAGKSKRHVESLLDATQGDIVVDYREGTDAVIEKLRQALDLLKAGPALYAFDTVSGGESLRVLGEVLAPVAHATFVLPEGDYTSIPESIRTSLTYVGDVHVEEYADFPSKGSRYRPSSNGRMLGFIFSRYFGKVLGELSFSAHPHQVIPGGLDGLSIALQNLRSGKASAVKYVVRLRDIA